MLKINKQSVDGLFPIKGGPFELKSEYCPSGDQKAISELINGINKKEKSGATGALDRKNIYYGKQYNLLKDLH